MAEKTGMQAWAEPGPITALSLTPEELSEMPVDLDVLAGMVQGLMLNLFWAEEQGVEIPEERLDEVELRTAQRMLDRILELDRRPLNAERSPGKRMVANSRDIAVLYTAILRARGVPARVRCGFSKYFRPGLYLEHWLSEVWLKEEERWILVDPQLDEVQREALRVNFPAVDVPRDQFLTGGQAWQICIADEADPEIFGLYGYTGFWFVRGSLVRDVLALAKVEILPWDSFGLIAKEEEQLTDEDLALLDELAEISAGENISFEEVVGVSERTDIRIIEM